MIKAGSPDSSHYVQAPCSHSVRHGPRGCDISCGPGVALIKVSLWGGAELRGRIGMPAPGGAFGTAEMEQTGFPGA